MSPLVLCDMGLPDPGPEGLRSEESCKVCRELTIVFQRFLIEHPVVHRSGMAALRRVLAGHRFEREQCWSAATFGVDGHLDLGPAVSLAGEPWTMDLLGEAVVDGPGREGCGVTGPPGAVPQPGLAPEEETADVAEGVEGEVEVDSEGAVDVIESDSGYLMEDLRDLMRDVCARWEEENFGLLLDVVACAAEIRQVVIREVAGGTGVDPLAGKVETTGANVREWVNQAAFPDGGPWTELAREVADAAGADEALLPDLRVLLAETLAGSGGEDSGPLGRAVA